MICLSPWADLTDSGASHANNAKSEALLDTASPRSVGGPVRGRRPARRPLRFPCPRGLPGLPPLLIQVDSGEILLDDSAARGREGRSRGRRRGA
ncbi:MAG: hypothetical protein MZU95_15520 [Desulfomicrobium escambiense]|nr:hypothetical protein [Desulfomicrobium escambiense]